MTLEVDRHEAFRRREHAVTSVGWVVMGVLVLAGLFGFVGPGPWSESTERSPGGAVEVGYLRVAHIEADDSLTLTFSPDAVEDGTIVADLTGPWVAGVDRQGITPTPSEETLIPGGVRLEFPAATTTGDPGRPWRSPSSSAPRNCGPCPGGWTWRASPPSSPSSSCHKG